MICSKFWLPLIMILLAMVFALIALMYILYWTHYVKRKKKGLLKKVQRKGKLFKNKFIHPGVYFEYCLRKDKMDDEKTAFYKTMFVISFMLWLLFFLISFVVYVVWK